MSTSEPKLEPMMNPEPQKEHRWLQKRITKTSLTSRATIIEFCLHIFKVRMV